MNFRGADESLFSLEADGRVETVTQFTRRVKLLLESGIRPGWIRGEVSNLRAQSSGHFYFSLKDGGAQLSAVLFRGDASRQTVPLRDGAQVLVYGEVSVYEARGHYQLIVRAIVDDGVGRLQREFEALKRKLAEEGLFDRERKKPLPMMPATIGFMSSPTGAAVQDFIRIMSRRGWRGRLVVLPVRVQGEGASGEMAEMLKRAERLGIFDLIVIGRGGGSLEDLWAFNEEILVRAVAACSVPVISAVGHEIDFSLCDFAADVRAETPSGAAELISSNFLNCLERLRSSADRLARYAREGREDASNQVAAIRARLRLLTPAARVEQGWLELDDAEGRLSSALQQALQLSRQRLKDARIRFVHRSPSGRIEVESHRLLSLWKRLQSASPASVLNRGFVIMRDANGAPVPRAVGLSPEARLQAEFADGRVALRVDGES